MSSFIIRVMIFCSTACSRLYLGDEGRGALLHQAVQRGPLGAMTLVVDRADIGRPLALPIRGLVALPR